MEKSIIQTGCLILATLCLQNAQGQPAATAGLYVCTGNDGIRTIVNKPDGRQCLPYQKGILSHNPAPTGSASSAPGKIPAASKPVKKIARPAARTQANTVSATQTRTSTASVNASRPLFPPAAGFTGSGSNEIYRLLGITASPTASAAANVKPLPQDKAALSADGEKLPPPAAAAPPAPAATATAEIWVCAKADHTPVIVESEQPLQDCQPLGRKGAVSDQAPAKPAPLPNRGKPLAGAQLAKGSGEIALTNSPPQDIYKCFDKQGNPNYVGASQRALFRHCRFFSRSFAGVHRDFIRETTRTKKDLTALAAAGVQDKKQAVDGPGLHCIGEGSITFNGESRHFNCATRSFDYTPGTSGGNIRLGNQQVSVGAHNLDYMNARGSCGGTITSENGRVFHLAPTKDCPQAVIIRAQRMLSQIEKQLNIPTSGAFRQRQRTLAAQINQIAREVGVDPYLVHAVISAESAYKYRAVSRAGARGLMQLMPATARRFGVNDSFHTGENIRGGATYLKWLLNYFNGDMTLAIAGYNAGEGNVRKYGNKIPPFIETRAYVPKVMQYYRRYRNNPSDIGL